MKTKTILKTYEVTYIYGTINPEVRKIKISSINDLTVTFIKEEILRQRPHQKNQIGEILSTLLIEEKVIVEVDDELSQEVIEGTKEIPVFNW